MRVSAKAAALIAEHGIDRQAFAGRGLITMREVLEFLGKPGATLEPAPPPTAPKPDQSAVAAVGVTYRIEPLSRAKRTEIKYLNSARHAALSSQVSVVVPTAGLRGVAENYPALRGNFTGLFVFETARLLRKYPLFNAFYANDEARIYDEVNIGYAVDAGLGLKVLVVRNADQKTLPAILTEIRDQVVRYLNDELSQADLAGGTFTITDLSGEGVCDFVPLINRGQSAILGVGAENAGPGNSVASFKLILAFDHQLSEGRRAAQFLGDIKTRLIGYEAALRPASNDAAANPAAQLHCAECLMTIQEIESMGGHMLQRVSANGSTGLICTTCAGGF
ncbi:MAG: 2-oxo acid dehydrogenase subunit E2 [Tepidisphaeraceae bacterium]